MSASPSRNRTPASQKTGRDHYYYARGYVPTVHQHMMRQLQSGGAGKLQRTIWQGDDIETT